MDDALVQQNVVFWLFEGIVRQKSALKDFVLTNIMYLFCECKMAVSTCKCTARKVKEYFRKNTQAGYENLIFLSGDGLFCQQLC